MNLWIYAMLKFSNIIVIYITKIKRGVIFMVQGLGLAKKYLEKINEITKLENGTYDVTFIDDVKVNYAPKG